MTGIRLAAVEKPLQARMFPGMIGCAAAAGAASAMKRIVAEPNESAIFRMKAVKRRDITVQLAADGQAVVCADEMWK